MLENNTLVLIIGLPEILLFGGILVLIFGATQIPKIARSLGEGLKEFKKSVKEAKDMEDEENAGEAEKEKKGKEKKTKSKK